ncbi:hypothetical protein BDF19DRAFT_186008 [Syncephalis fuscata]|nr:hypothetical protein BDF19DRAFT_186008 [Syncephalis fuscata]
MLVQAVAFLHYAGVAHNNINPDTIRFYKNGESSQLMLTNYTKATIIKMNTATKVPIPQVPPTTSMGYEAPESMVIPKINVKKRDSWMTALMAYFAVLACHPMDLCIMVVNCKCNHLASMKSNWAVFTMNIKGKTWR